MWEQVKWAVVERAKEMCGSVQLRGGNPNSVWWNDQVEAVVKRKEELEARDEDARERCLEVYIEEKRKVKRFIYQSKKVIQEQFGRKKNQDVNGNRKLLKYEGFGMSITRL